MQDGPQLPPVLLGRAFCAATGPAEPQLCVPGVCAASLPSQSQKKRGCFRLPPQNNRFCPPAQGSHGSQGVFISSSHSSGASSLGHLSYEGREGHQHGEVYAQQEEGFISTQSRAGNTAQQQEPLGWRHAEAFSCSFRSFLDVSALSRLQAHSCFQTTRHTASSLS